MIRNFLRRTWGVDAIDAGLLEYSVITMRQPGAVHAFTVFQAGALPYIEEGERFVAEYDAFLGGVLKAGNS